MLIPLGRLVNDIQSKNAGINVVCCDIFFDDYDLFSKVRDSGSLTREKVAEYFHLPPERIINFEVDERFFAYKIAIQREQSAGGPGERDLYGTGLYSPLADYELDL